MLRRKRWFGIGKRGTRREQVSNQRVAPAVEPLEGRTLLSVSFGNLTEQGGAPSAMGITRGFYNGDSNVDLAVASTVTSGGATAGQVLIYMGNGDGTFQSPITLSDPGSHEAYAITTYQDENGKTDLAVTNPLDGTITNYVSNGDGTFQAPKVSTYGTPQAASSGAIANIAPGNFGVHVGLVVTDPSDHQIDLMFSNGDGTFTVAQRFDNNGQANFNPNSIVAGGFVGNVGGYSIGYSQLNSDTIYTAAWNGSGFTAGNSYSTGAGVISQMVAAGLMNSGLPDIAATTAYGYVAVLQNQGSGNFTLLGSPIGIPFKNPTAIAAGFFDPSNNFIDIAVMDSSGDIAVSSNQGNGFFTLSFEYKPITSGAPQRMIAANLYGGTEQDLVFTELKSGLTSGGGIASLKNGGNPTPPPGGGGGGVTGNTSSLVGTFSGKLPTTAVSGVKGIIRQTLTVKNSGTTAMKGLLSGTLFLTTAQSATSNSLAISGAQSKKINLKPGKSIKIPIRIASLPAGTNGNYYLMMQLTDPGGHLADAFTGNAISVAVPTIDFAGKFVKVPASAKAGKPTTATIAITNNGNVPAKGALPVLVYVSTTPTLGPNPTLAGSKPFKINLKPGKTMRITVPKLALPAGSDYLIAQVDPGNLFNETTTADNTFASSTPITVA